jgi:hypothetical protein
MDTLLRTRSRRWVSSLLIVAAAVGAAGCVGVLDGDPATTGDPTPQPPAEPAEHGVRLPRLSHVQWARTVQAFLRLTDPPISKVLRDDPPHGESFETDDRLRTIDKPLVLDYRTQADALAEQTFSNNEAFAKLVVDGGEGDAPTRLRRLITVAWPRAYRRPLTTEEIERYVAIGLAEPDYAAAGSDDERLKIALRVLVRITLQSPHFIYRVELGDASAEVQQDKYRVRPLTANEYATRLAYTLFDAPPDEALIAAVTSEGPAFDVSKLVDDPRAAETLLRFHRALYEVEASISMATKNPGKFPDMALLGSDAAKEAELFLDDVVKNGGSLRDVLLSRTTFVNHRLATIYGLPTDGLTPETFSPFELPAERAGILTRVSWTGLNADAVERSSVLRGVYVTRKFLCTQLAAPPAGAVEGKLPPPPTLISNRDKISFQTEAGTCASCHKHLINPNGFAFEGFDAIGKFLTEENGVKVDASGETTLDGERVSFTGARDFLEKAAEAKQVHGCYVNHLDSWVLGRQLADFERADAAPTVGRSVHDRASVRAILTALLTAPAFRSVVREVP